MIRDPGVRCNRHTRRPFDPTCRTCNTIGAWSPLIRGALPADKGLDLFTNTKGASEMPRPDDDEIRQILEDTEPHDMTPAEIVTKATGH